MWKVERTNDLLNILRSMEYALVGLLVGFLFLLPLEKSFSYWSFFLGFCLSVLLALIAIINLFLSILIQFGHLGI